MNLKEIGRYFSKRRRHLTKEEYKMIMEVLKKIEKKEHLSSVEAANELRKKGNEECEAGDFRAALESYTQAILHAPKNGRYLLNRAVAYCKLGMVEEAIKDCEEGIKLKPKFIKLYVRLSLLYIKKNDIKKAEKILERGLLIDPENKSLKKQKALLEGKTSQTERQINNNESASFEKLFDTMRLLGEKNGSKLGLDSFLTNESVKELINNVVENKNPQGLAKMVEDMMSAMNNNHNKKK